MAAVWMRNAPGITHMVAAPIKLHLAYTCVGQCVLASAPPVIANGYL